MSEIFVLSGDLGFARFDRDEATAPDPAIRHFLLAFGYVEAPSGIGLDERQRQGPTPTRRIFSPIGSIVDRGQRGRCLVELLQFWASWSVSPDLSNAARPCQESSCRSPASWLRRNRRGPSPLHPESPKRTDHACASRRGRLDASFARPPVSPFTGEWRSPDDLRPLAIDRPRQRAEQKSFTPNQTALGNVT